MAGLKLVRRKDLLAELAIVPVANDPEASPNRGAKGWLPLVVEGHIEVDGTGQVQFSADKIVSLQ